MGLFRKITKLTIFKHCCDLGGLNAQQEKGLMHLWKFCKEILPNTMDEQIAWCILGLNLQLIFSFPTHYQLNKYNERIIIVLPYWPNIQRQHYYLA